MTDNITENLPSCLKELRLPTVRRCYEPLAKTASDNEYSYEAYLYELMVKECDERFSNRVMRLLRESKLPLEKRMDTLDLKRFPKKITQQVKALLQGEFIKNKENVLAFGNPGSGKTHLLCAIGQQLVTEGCRLYFTSCSLLVQELLLAKRDLKLSRVIKRFSQYDAILIDDIGYVQQEREEMEVLFTLLAERYERGSVMITSNLPFSKWEKIFKDPMTTAAAIDRLIHHSIILELNLRSYRMEQAKQSQQDLDSSKSCSASLRDALLPAPNITR